MFGIFIGFAIVKLIIYIEQPIGFLVYSLNTFQFLSHFLRPSSFTFYICCIKIIV